MLQCCDNKGSVLQYFMLHYCDNKGSVLQYFMLQYCDNKGSILQHFQYCGSAREQYVEREPVMVMWHWVVSLSPSPHAGRCSGDTVPGLIQMTSDSEVRWLRLAFQPVFNIKVKTLQGVHVNILQKQSKKERL